jgi:hypothetical protein
MQPIHWADNCRKEWLPKAKIEPPHIDLKHFNEFIERAKADGEKAMEWLKEQISECINKSAPRSCGPCFLLSRAWL